MAFKCDWLKTYISLGFTYKNTPKKRHSVDRCNPKMKKKQTFKMNFPYIEYRGWVLK